MAQDEAKPIGPDLSQGISLDQLADGKITPEDWTAIPQESARRARASGSCRKQSS